MEAAGVPESTTQLIVGHKRQSLTYGHYSKGERLRKDLREYREYIGRLRYSNEVMKLIRGGRNGKRQSRASSASRASTRQKLLMMKPIQGFRVGHKANKLQKKLHSSLA
jgi:hypothetical protein